MGAHEAGPTGSDLVVARRHSTNHLRRTLLPPARVQELSQRRTGRVVWDTARCWALIVGAWALVAAAGTWWAVALAFPIVGTRFYALFIIGHDGLHRRLFEDKERNDLFNDLFVLAPIGTITRINNRNHLRHHQHLGTGGDPDRHKHGCFNKATSLQLVGYLTAVTTVVTSVRHVLLSDQGARSSDEDAGPDRPTYRGRDIALLVGWQVALLAGLWWAIGWWAYIVLWWSPVFVFTFLGDNLRTFVEHSQLTDDPAADDHRLVTNEPGWLELQLFAPMHMNFHATHHLWPAIPYYNLPKANAEMRIAPAADALTWRGSYIGYVLRYVRALPIAGCEKSPSTSVGPAAIAAT